MEITNEVDWSISKTEILGVIITLVPKMVTE
jgi:hypothetical protein